MFIIWAHGLYERGTEHTHSRDYVGLLIAEKGLNFLKVLSWLILIENRGNQLRKYLLKMRPFHHGSQIKLIN